MNPLNRVDEVFTENWTIRKSMLPMDIKIRSVQLKQKKTTADHYNAELDEKLLSVSTINKNNKKKLTKKKKKKDTILVSNKSSRKKCTSFKGKSSVVRPRLRRSRRKRRKKSSGV